MLKRKKEKKEISLTACSLVTLSSSYPWVYNIYCKSPPPTHTLTLLTYLYFTPPPPHRQWHYTSQTQTQTQTRTPVSI